MSVYGPVTPNPSQDPSKKRKPEVEEINLQPKSSPKTSSSSLESASPELTSHLETTRTLEEPNWNYTFSQNDYAYLAEKVRLLHTIRIHGDIIPEQVLIRVIENNKDSLQEVSLESCPQYSAALFSKLASCRQLRVLLVPRNTQLNSTMVAHIASISTLQKLDLEDCIQLSDTDLQHIATGNVELNELKVRACKNLTDRGIEFLAQGARKLSILDISWCPQITDRGLLALAEHAKRLTSLNLRSCREVTDTGVRRIVQELPLQVLSIRGCVKLTDETVFEIADSARRTIQRLDLSHCQEITDEGIKALSEYCQTLQNLDITSCKRITSFAVHYLARELKTLEVLAVDKIWESQLASLSDNFPKLRELNVSGIASTADEFAAARISQALKTLCAKTTSLQRLGISGTELGKALGEQFFTSLQERKIELI
jgi:bacterioferritin-associated ferredoxin